MKIAIIGVTGLVGNVMRDVLAERNLPISQFIPVASEKSVGKEIEFHGSIHKIVSLQTAVDLQPDVAIFSAGGSVSLEWAPKFAAVGTTVVDNSSAWRMDSTKKLIVPEINANILTKEDKIIANPNCSTIQLVMALHPLRAEYKIKRLVISTYQSITGTGVVALNQYDNEKHGKPVTNPAYPHPIFDNCLPHCDVFLKNDYTREEMKLVNETRKIFNDDSIRITATAIRVPVHGGHSESVNIEFENEFSMTNVRKLIRNQDGIILQDDTKNNIYPMPLYAKGKDDVFVGRLRRDESIENGLNMWIVADNLRKGAATNTIQIVEYLMSNKLIK